MESGRVLEKSRIRASTGEGLNPSENWRRVEFGTSTEKGYEREPGKVDSRRVPEKGRIRVSTGKGSGRVLGKVDSKRIPDKGRIWASTGEGYNPA